MLTARVGLLGCRIYRTAHIIHHYGGYALRRASTAGPLTTHLPPATSEMLTFNATHAPNENTIEAFNIALPKLKA